MRKRRVLVAVTLVALQMAAARFLGTTSLAVTGDPRSGGDTTVFDDTRNAFSLPARNLREDHRSEFFVGNSYFNQNWLVAPASVSSRDGLGPLFNQRSCSGCHFKDGRSRPPDEGGVMDTMLLRISIPGAGEHGEPRPDPVYGDQIQGQAIPGIPGEADVVVRYEEAPGAFADGERFSLRTPTYEIRHLGYGPLSTDLLTSPRVAPSMIGLGLLEAVPSATIEELADPNDADGDGVSGRMNRVWSVVEQRAVPGRFGWKAEQPSVEQQTAGAFVGDIGITSRLFRREAVSEIERQAMRPTSGGDPEVSDHIFNAVVRYSRTLAVPAARTDEDPAQRGRALFVTAGCAVCHRTELVTGDVADLPELAHQTIHPYTDLLLHDLGHGLSDDRPAFDASGREWRTPPLWGLGLIGKVNGHTFLLHDGRARNVTEAILWHDGEARSARERFRTMSRPERDALVAFLNSL